MSRKIEKLGLSAADKEEQTLEEKRKKDMAKYIGNNIHQYRINMKLTREQLAEKSHLTASHLYQLAIITVLDICNALNITVAQITDDLLYNNVNKFVETISADFNKLTDNQKNAIVQLIKNLIEQ